MAAVVDRDLDLDRVRDLDLDRGRGRGRDQDQDRARMWIFAHQPSTATTRSTQERATRLIAARGSHVQAHLQASHLWIMPFEPLR